MKLIKDVGFEDIKIASYDCASIPLLKDVKKFINYIEGKFDFIVSRAVSRLDKFIPWVEGKIDKRAINAWPNGILCLKGGDLKEELEEVNHPTEELQISQWFTEEYFETKAVIYVTL